MTPFLITTAGGSELWFVESSRFKLGPDSKPEEVVGSYRDRSLYYEYRNHPYDEPTFAYHFTERTSHDAEWIVYREADNGDLLCVGGVRSQLLSSPSSEGARACIVE